MTGRRVAWLGLSSPPALTRRTPTKGSALRLRGGRRTPLVAYAPSLSCAPPERIHLLVYRANREIPRTEFSKSP